MVDLCILLLLSSFELVGASTKEENGVAILTAANFEAVVGEHDFAMVAFYAPWCVHSQRLNKEYEYVAKKLKVDHPNILLAKVDATVESELATKHDIKGYPTLKFHKNGSWVKYNGEPKETAIYDWILRKTKEAARQLQTLNELDEFINSNVVAVVGFFEENHPSLSVFEKVADELDKHPFAWTSLPEAREKYGVTKSAHVSLFKKFDEGRADHEIELTAPTLTNFVQMESIPLIVEFSHENASDVFASPVRTHFVAFVSRTNKFEDLKNEMFPVAKNFKGKVHFLVIDTDQEDHDRILSFFGMTKDEVPAYRLINLSDDMTKYQPDDSSFTNDAMTKFIDEVLTGVRKPFLMSQEIPPKSDSSVLELVGKNYNEVVKNESVAVFVKLYAPWCGHCKQLAPIWDDLGKEFKGRDDIVIAKMDATANEAEGLRVTSFPTLKYYPKGNASVRGIVRKITVY
ncbi:unnamed protein product [Dicrocoelium dendriticum]|nr:unnamed protein product [Dicrocoelium dendriticum]